MLKPIPVLNDEEWLARCRAARDGLDDRLFAMYSSVTGGIMTDPALMTVPMDDHIVHRGDGVFESFKCIGGSIYNLPGHLERLEKSCNAIGLEQPWTAEEITEITAQTVRAGKKRDCLIRLLVSRGPGNMGINPYDCLRPELYLMVYRFDPKPPEAYEKGVKVRLSRIPVKPGIFATVKSCNYLPNVLMKKEAVDWNVDFTVSIDERRNLAEGATENLAIVTRAGELLIPPPDRVLAGTTVQRVFALAEKLVSQGRLQRVEYCPISIGAARAAAEFLIIGTTADVVPVTEFEGAPVGNGRPGPVCRLLLEKLREDISANRHCRLVIFEEDK